MLPTRPSLNTSVLKWKRVSGISAGRLWLSAALYPDATSKTARTFVFGRSMISQERSPPRPGAGESFCTRYFMGLHSNGIGFGPPEEFYANLARRFRRLSSVTGSLSRSAVVVGAMISLLLSKCFGGSGSAQGSCRGSEFAAPRSQLGQLSGNDWTQPVAGRVALLRVRTGVWAGDLHAAQERSGAPLDARDFGADLRNLQDLSGHAGQIHPRSLGIYRGHYYCLLRMARTRTGQTDRGHVAGHLGCSAWSVSRAATGWRGSASGSTRSPTRVRLSPAFAASRIPFTPFRSRRA